MKGEREIREELRRRERIFYRMKNDPSCPFSACSFMEAYISALKWVLEDE